ncbi:hypothetical protein NMG60_11014211 [Bertholletia excelsa]
MNRHARLVKLGLDTNTAFATRLINDYVSFSGRTPSSLAHAHKLFDELPQKDTILWTSFMSACTRSSHPSKALRLFSLMLRLSSSTVQPNHFVFPTVFRAVASAPEHLQLGRTAHSLALKYGYLASNVVVDTALLDMYAKGGVLGCACKVFNEMPERNLVTWNAMIAGYVHNGMEIYGLHLFHRMKCVELCEIDEFTVATVLAGCARAEELVLGMQIHANIIVSGFESIFCREVASAKKLLSVVEGDFVSRLIKIRGYVINQRYFDAIDYVASKNDISEIFEADRTIFVPLLTACAELTAVRIGRQVHGILITTANSYGNNYLLEDGGDIIHSALINMYCKCKSAGEARKVFDVWKPTQPVSLWNSMISGYIYNGLLENARELWEKVPEKNTISWTSMISGYVHNGLPKEGLDLLAELYSSRHNGSKAVGNSFTFVLGLEASSCIANLDAGKQIHAKLLRTLIKAEMNNVVVGTALIDMYSKAGCLIYAQNVFDLMEERNVFAWTSIIMGYAVHGFGFRALEFFQEMMEGESNQTSHCGLVDEGLKYFKLMREKYRLIPTDDHYTCLIDMLGRAGRLEEAQAFLESIGDVERRNGGSSGTVWAAMLGACQLHGNVEMGSKAAKKMIESKTQLSSTYIALSNVYAGAGMWNEVYNVRESWIKGGVSGDPGFSHICINRTVS